ncbi:MAG: hypothetical protein FWF72_02190 [Paludibacter sp.]|nr:hypothetical protein [Paludibacter sp.]
MGQSKTRSDYNVLHINALTGDPSTFWQHHGLEERWFCNKKDAYNAYKEYQQSGVLSNYSGQTNPDQFRLNKTFWQKNKDLILSIGLVLAVAAVVWFLTNPQQLKTVPRRFGYAPPKVEIR